MSDIQLGYILGTTVFLTGLGFVWFALNIEKLPFFKDMED